MKLAIFNFIIQGVTAIASTVNFLSSQEVGWLVATLGWGLVCFYSLGQIITEKHRLEDMKCGE